MDKRPNDEQSALEHNTSSVLFHHRKNGAGVTEQNVYQNGLHEEVIKTKAKAVNAQSYRHRIKIISGGWGHTEPPSYLLLLFPVSLIT